MGNHCIAIRTGDRVYRNYQLGWKIKICVADDDVVPDSLDYSTEFQALQAQTLTLSRSIRLDCQRQENGSTYREALLDCLYQELQDGFERKEMAIDLLCA